MIQHINAAETFQQQYTVYKGIQQIMRIIALYQKQIFPIVHSVLTRANLL